RARHVVVDAREQQRESPHVVALLPLAVAAAHHHVADRALVELGVALDQRAQRDRREIIGANGLQRPLRGAADRRTDGINDDCFGHVRVLLRSRGYRSRRLTPSSSKPTWWASSWRTVRVTWSRSSCGSLPKSRRSVSRKITMRSCVCACATPPPSYRPYAWRRRPPSEITTATCASALRSRSGS